MDREIIGEMLGQSEQLEKELVEGALGRDGDELDEKKKVPKCSKCGKRHWPFQKCSSKKKIKEDTDSDDDLSKDSIDELSSIGILGSFDGYEKVGDIYNKRRFNQAVQEIKRRGKNAVTKAGEILKTIIQDATDVGDVFPKSMLRIIAEALGINWKDIQPRETKENIIPDNKDDEATKIKKLTEQPEEDPSEDIIPSEEEFPEEEIPDEKKPEEEPEKEPVPEKVYVGNTKDTHYYLITKTSDTDVQEGFQIVDQEGDVVYPTEEKGEEVESEDITDFLIAAIKEIKMESITFDVYTKYIIPKIEELERQLKEPEPELGGAEEVPEEEEPPMESKINFKGKDYTVKVVEKKNNGEFIIAINDKKYNLGSAFMSLFVNEKGELDESSLTKLTLDVLSNLSEGK